MAGLAALQFVPESFDLGPGKLVGRRMASIGFIEAWIRYSGADPITGYVTAKKHKSAFTSYVRSLDPAVAIETADLSNLSSLRDAGALWIGDPVLARHAWNRRWHRQADWSLIGITHSMSSHSAMGAVVDMVRAPIQPWDALICTSRAIRSTVETLLRAEMEYLHGRMGATRFTIPELPVIPLGVDCEALRPDPAQRAAWRAELGIAEQEVVVLQFGRLAYHAKAHPVPLYHALAEAGRRSGKRLHLVFAGQFPNPHQERQYRVLAAEMRERVATHFVDGARPDVDGVRSAADIGTLMSDNIQETFGLAPIELMATGLPVIGTDWDGLRDTIDDGKTGFRIETTMPPPGAGAALAWRYASVEDNDMFIARAAQATAFDIGQAAARFETLALDPLLRAEMGAAAQERARAVYNWPRVIDAYRGLLDQLAELRRSADKESVPRIHPMPANPAWADPFSAFAGFATASIGPDVAIAAAPGAPERLSGLKVETKSGFLDAAVQPLPDGIEAIFEAIGAEPQSPRSLVRLFPDIDPGQIVCAMAWLLKFGVAVRA